MEPDAIIVAFLASPPLFACSVVAFLAYKKISLRRIIFAEILTFFTSSILVFGYLITHMGDCLSDIAGIDTGYSCNFEKNIDFLIFLVPISCVLIFGNWLILRPRRV